MPMYEYKCRDCGSVVEHLVGVGRDQPKIACESCGSTSLAQLMSLVSIAPNGFHSEQPVGCCGGRNDCSGDCGCNEARG